MEKDRSETTNLADEYPELVRELSEAWQQWAETHMVFPLDGRDWDNRLEEPVFKRLE